MTGRRDGTPESFFTVIVSPGFADIRFAAAVPVVLHGGDAVGGDISVVDKFAAAMLLVLSETPIPAPAPSATEVDGKGGGGSPSDWVARASAAFAAASARRFLVLYGPRFFLAGGTGGTALGAAASSLTLTVADEGRLADTAGLDKHGSESP